VAWIFFSFLPVLAFPLITYMADRYPVCALLGFCWILAAGILWLAAACARTADVSRRPSC
jgi:hypothetical protein